MYLLVRLFIPLSRFEIKDLFEIMTLLHEL